MESVYFQVQKNYTNLSSTEQLVIDFILNYENVEALKLRIVEDSLHTSATTIIRAVKKLDYKSFTEFKYAIINSRDSDEKVNSNQDFDSLIRTIKSDFDRTINMMDKEKMLESASSILNSRRIFCVGMGSSMNVINSLNRNFKTLGLWSNDYTEASPFRDVPDISRKDDCLIVVSLKGKEPQILDIVAMCKIKGVKVIAITGFPNNQLSELSDITLFASQTIQDRRKLRSRLMLSVVSDILFETILLQKNITES